MKSDKLDLFLIVSAIVLICIAIAIILIAIRDLNITPDDPPRMDDTTTMFNPDKYQIGCDPPCTGCKNSLEERPEPHFPKVR